MGRDELEKLFKALRDSPSFGGTNLLTVKLNAALTTVDHGLDPFTIHDLRRTVRAHLSSLGIRSEVAERCLNHKLPGIQAVYNTHDYFAERRAALETWTALPDCYAQLQFSNEASQRSRTMINKCDETDKCQ